MKKQVLTALVAGGAFLLGSLSGVVGARSVKLIDYQQLKPVPIDDGRTGLEVPKADIVIVNWPTPVSCGKQVAVTPPKAPPKQPVVPPPVAPPNTPKPPSTPVPPPPPAPPTIKPPAPPTTVPPTVRPPDPPPATPEPKGNGNCGVGNGGDSDTPGCPGGRNDGTGTGPGNPGAQGGNGNNGGNNGNGNGNNGNQGGQGEQKRP